jgi:hypothetical protein
MIEKLREMLERNRHEPWLVADHMKYLPELKVPGLNDLAWLLASNEYGCHYNDVKGLIDLLEKHLNDKEG